MEPSFLSFVDESAVRKSTILARGIRHFSTFCATPLDHENDIRIGRAQIDHFSSVKPSFSVPFLVPKKRVKIDHFSSWKLMAGPGRAGSGRSLILNSTSYKPALRAGIIITIINTAGCGRSHTRFAIPRGTARSTPTSMLIPKLRSSHRHLLKASHDISHHSSRPREQYRNLVCDNFAPLLSTTGMISGSLF